MSARHNRQEPASSSFSILKMKCCLCNSDANDERNFGKIMKTRRVTAHYYCVLLSHELPQNGRDRQGILGFLERDILALVENRKNKRCIYCKKSGATQKCLKCNKFYHLPCLLGKGGRCYFHPYFGTLCHQHYKKPRINKEMNYNWNCMICLENTNLNVELVPPCCKRNTLHISCAQQLAENSAFYTKCPMCQNVEVFQQYLAANGIFIEHRESTWNNETINPSPEGNDFTQCKAKECLCRMGRNYILLNHSLYDLIACYYCGTEAAHIKCAQNNKFTCITCEDVVNRLAPKTPLSNNNESKNNVEIATPNQQTEKDLTKCDRSPSRRSSRYGRIYRFQKDSPLFIKNSPFNR